ncbi:MAG: hypothetical protein WCT33_02245 [Patescibacteria group bacterium]
MIGKVDDNLTPQETESQQWENEVEKVFSNVEYLQGPEARKQRDNFSQNDSKLKERTRNAEVLFRYLKRYTGKEVAIREVSKGIFEISFENSPNQIPELPEGYGYKGGAARAHLESTLGIKQSSVRDLDIVFLGKTENKEVTDMLAREYMPEDYENGYGVESLDSDYFDTRDFTINEVYVGDRHNIIATQQCILDTIRRILRVTEFEKKDRIYDEGDYWVNPKILAKALRLLAQETSRGQVMEFADRDAVGWIGIDSFHMALHLDRAMGQSQDTAYNYIQELIDNGQLPSDINTPELAADYLKADLYDFVFKAPRFKGVDSGLTGEDELIYWEEEFGELVDLPTFQSFSKSPQNKLQK